MTDRRTVLAGLSGVALAGAAAPAAVASEVPLWPGAPPGAPAKLPPREIEQRILTTGAHDDSVVSVGRPWLAVRRPAHPNGAAVLVLPGGGYSLLSWNNEGEEQAAWLGALGVTSFILGYRLPAQGWADRARVPLADAQRALRVIRARAAEFGIDAGRVAVLGFSAGGHLAGSLATRFAEPAYAPVDAADRLSARPALAGMIYPVVTLAPPFAHSGSRDALLGQQPGAEAVRAASLETRVTAQTPPVFLVHAGDDATVPPQHSLLFYQAMLAALRPAELHVFERGGHGFGVRLPRSTPAARWPELFAAYARAKGVLPG